MRIADTVVEVFSDLPSGHPLFERFSMIRASDLELFADIVEEADADKPNRGLSDTAVDRLISLALGYIEPRHRLGLVTPELEEQILSARKYFRDHCPEDIIDQIEFYDAARVMDAAPIGDNLLFGRVAHNVANAEQRIASFLKDVLPALDMERLVYSIGLDFDVGSHGQALFAPQRAAISIARGLIQRPQILILEDALKAFSEEQRDLVLSTVGRWMHGKTLILTATEVPPAIPFNLEVQVDETRVRVSEALQEDAGDQVNASEISSRDSGPDGAIADPLANAKAK